LFYYSRDRSGAHAQAHLANYAGILQADAFAGYNKLYEADRKPSPLVEAACCMPAGPSSSWPTSPPTPAARRRARPQ